MCCPRPPRPQLLATAGHVALYDFDVAAKKWARKDVEGSLFLVKRREPPRFQFVILNKKNDENFVEDVGGGFQCEVRRVGVELRVDNCSDAAHGACVARELIWRCFGGFLPTSWVFLSTSLVSFFFVFLSTSLLLLARRARPTAVISLAADVAAGQQAVLPVPQQVRRSCWHLVLRRGRLRPHLGTLAGASAQCCHALWGCSNSKSAVRPSVCWCLSNFGWRCTS